MQIPGLGDIGVQFQTAIAKNYETATKELVKRKCLHFGAKKDVREQCNLKNIRIEFRDILSVLQDDAGGEGQTEP